jgi:hypothetical protein
VVKELYQREDGFRGRGLGLILGGSVELKLKAI